MIYKTLEELKNMPDVFWQTPGQLITSKRKAEKEFLNKPTERVESVELGEKIAAKLIKTLDKINKFKRKGIALTANQIGIPASVCVINVNGILYFINPDIVETSKHTILFKESCLSVPNKDFKIKRHVKVKVMADNLVEPVWFGVDTVSDELDYQKLVEAITIQHEFNHTQGILISDLVETKQPIVNEYTIGRNEKVVISKNGSTKAIKYKYYDKFKKDGWIFV